MKKLIIVGFATIALAGCASKEKPPVAPAKATAQKETVDARFSLMNKKARLDVKSTVSDLLDYCERWAAAFEANLGKDPFVAFNECVELTSDNMRKQADERLEGTKSSPADFPFQQ